MKKLILIGRSGAGKTSLTQALRGEKIAYRKTQYVSFGECLIDTPGEYAENPELAHALALYSYEADIVGLLLGSDEPYSLYAPNITSQANRDVIGIVTKTDKKEGRPDLAEMWLKLAGCRKIFFTSSYTGEGISEILEYIS